MKRAGLGPGGSNLSLMIPTFHCARYLRDTLESLRRQPPGTLDQAEIVVVDDASTEDDPAAVVREFAPAVRFHRHERNMGQCANFNACLALAGRPWIQILHGDDYMLPGAYAGFESALAEDPEALAVFGRVQIVTAENRILGESPALGPESQGRLRYDPMMWRRNPVYPGAVLLHRSVFDLAGQF